MGSWSSKSWVNSSSNASTSRSFMTWTRRSTSQRLSCPPGGTSGDGAPAGAEIVGRDAIGNSSIPLAPAQFEAPAAESTSRGRRKGGHRRTALPSSWHPLGGHRRYPARDVYVAAASAANGTRVTVRPIPARGAQRVESDLHVADRPVDAVCGHDRRPAVGPGAARVSPARNRPDSTRPTCTRAAMRSVAMAAARWSCTTMAPKVIGGEMASARHWSCSSRTRSLRYWPVTSPLTGSTHPPQAAATVCSSAQAPSARASRPTGSMSRPTSPGRTARRAGPARPGRRHGVDLWSDAARAWAKATIASSDLGGDVPVERAARCRDAGSAHSSKRRPYRGRVPAVIARRPAGEAARPVDESEETDAPSAPRCGWVVVQRPHLLHAR